MKAKFGLIYLLVVHFENQNQNEKGFENQTKFQIKIQPKIRGKMILKSNRLS